MRRSSRGRLVGRIVLVLVVAASVVLGLAWFAQRSFIYYPEPLDPGPARTHLPHAQDVTLSTDDGLELQAWWAPAAGQARDEVVLYLPGNGGNRADRVEVAQALNQQGFAVLLLDYRGYGGNPGSPSEEGLVLDARAAVDHLRSEGFEPAQIIYVGESIGTGVAVQLAEIDPPRAVLLRSPYTSLSAVASRSFGGVPVGWLLRDRFDTIGRIPDVTVPVRVLYGDRDTLIPPAQSLEVARAAPHLAGVDVLEGAGHNDPRFFGPYLAEQTALLADTPS